MRILMLVPFPGVRGPLSRHTQLLVDGLRSTGCSVTTEPWGRHRDDESLVAKIAGRPIDIARIRRRLSRERFDVMVVKTSHEWPTLARDLPLLAATRRLVPSIVLQFHGGRSDRLVAPGHLAFKGATAALFRLTSGVLFLSSQQQRESQQFWRQGRFHLVANPFVPPAADGSAGASQRDQDVPTLLFASRLIAEKGIFDTISALAMLRERVRCRLVIAGSGPEGDRVAEQVHELGLDEDVVLAGHLSSQELVRAYGKADIFVLPTYWVEGFPTVITEAMAAGLPIVATRTRGIADHLEESVNAVFVAPREPAELAEALERLLADDGLRNRMSRANREKVMDFAPDAVAERYFEALEEIVRR